LQAAARRRVWIDVPGAIAAGFHALVAVRLGADAHETGAAVAEMVAQDPAHAAAQKICVGVRVPEPQHVHVALTYPLLELAERAEECAERACCAGCVIGGRRR